MFQNDGNGQSPNWCSSERQAVKVIRNNTNQCPAIKNHTSVHYKNQIFIFGGYDSKKNHNDIHIYKDGNWTKCKANGKIPESRNGHTATVVDNKMYVIGGWLGSGIYASRDVYVLDLDCLNWTLVNTMGEVPGPCNMHSADQIGQLIFIFRGGDGKDYLNDLHSFNTKTNMWKLVQTAENQRPPPRANHSSAVWQNKLLIFGGWDGSKRLNDLHCYDVTTNKWCELKPIQSPSARAGMCMTTIENKIYLFGGSGPQTTCFGDLQCYDPIKNAWTTIELQDDEQFDKARAGHSMTAIGNLIYIFGGSCGSYYFKDYFIIDTDPPPNISVTDFNNISLNQYFRAFFNSPKYSDIIFVVEDKHLYAHKIVLSRYEMFKKMFEWEYKNQQQKVYINDCSNQIFEQLLYFIYAGDLQCDQFQQSVEFYRQFLQLADYYLIPDLKSLCEKQLSLLIDNTTFPKIKLYAEQMNANQLLKFCEWYESHNN
ncbi:unnamed protein product (macronuclear) [Paramecium tetraurelia]|uniref:BTB domain-containing protein n=1 Tax=Paramecium tetraurelia TaxID=5888 RepID=A0DE28_PARTE|nr:uncharacterized protein GSPATT00016137001 [Paramecium tetraurelia]CAK81295.1 unnamed protein product [Paramecium tetraurelia]|eukprot:XP_001448692.1 hypothetical protein (macronuclear) [Paramecium tetraurelia strain d4-2]